MADVKIELNAETLAEQVTNALVSSLVGKIVSGVITNRVIKEDALNREYENAVAQVARESFIAFLKTDAGFQAKLREMITQTASEQFLKQFLEKMQRYVSLVRL